MQVTENVHLNFNPTCAILSLPEISCLTAVTSDPDRLEEVDPARGCGLLPGDTTVSSLILLLSGMSAMWMWSVCGPGGEGVGGEGADSLASTGCGGHDMDINMWTEYSGHMVRPGDQWMTGEDLLP